VDWDGKPVTLTAERLPLHRGLAATNATAPRDDLQRTLARFTAMGEAAHSSPEAMRKQLEELVRPEFTMITAAQRATMLPWYTESAARVAAEWTPVVKRAIAGDASARMMFDTLDIVDTKRLTQLDFLSRHRAELDQLLGPRMAMLVHLMAR